MTDGGGEDSVTLFSSTFSSVVAVGFTVTGGGVVFVSATGTSTRFGTSSFCRLPASFNSRCLLSSTALEASSCISLNTSSRSFSAANSTNKFELTAPAAQSTEVSLIFFILSDHFVSAKYCDSSGFSRMVRS